MKKTIFFIFVVLNITILLYLFFFNSLKFDTKKNNLEKNKESVQILNDDSYLEKTISLCGSFGGINTNQIDSIKEKLSSILSDDYYEVFNKKIKTNWTVIIPPQRSLTKVNEKIKMLEDLKINNFQELKENNKWKFSILLGNFVNKNSAKAYQKFLSSIGIRDTVVSEKEGEETIFFVNFKNIRETKKKLIDNYVKNILGYSFVLVDCEKN